MHPFAPLDQAAGLPRAHRRARGGAGRDHRLRRGVAAAQRRLAGRVRRPLAIQAYHRSRGDDHRTCASSPRRPTAPTPPARPWPACEVVVVACDDDGNVDVADLEAKVDAAGDRLSCLMVTYPSTHGVFEAAITDICDAGPRPRRAGVPRRRQPQRPGRRGQARAGSAPTSPTSTSTRRSASPTAAAGPAWARWRSRAHLAPFLPNHPLVGRGRARPPAPAPSPPRRGARPASCPSRGPTSP